MKCKAQNSTGYLPISGWCVAHALTFYKDITDGYITINKKDIIITHIWLTHVAHALALCDPTISLEFLLVHVVRLSWLLLVSGRLCGSTRIVLIVGMVILRTSV